MKKTIFFTVLATLCLFLKLPAQEISPQSGQIISGKVSDEQGQVLPGATVQLQGTKHMINTGPDGAFKMPVHQQKGVLIVSFTGYQKAFVPYNTYGNLLVTIALKPDLNSINEVQVIGYGTSTRRLNTGSVATISAKDIEKQPVTNFLSALSGRAAGVFVQTTNGLPGGNVSITIRGKGSLTAGTNPLYVIDGIPFNASIGDLTRLNTLSASAINGVISPFNSINPDDIESISILKDADATAIYGSRGSNGVVLITTKKGKAGKTRIDLSLSEGANQVANLPRLLSPEQYFQIRTEAFANDGITPSSDPGSGDYAPDLTVWKNKGNTDWAKYLLGGTGHMTNAQATISGGNAATTFTAGLNYHSEKTFLPGDNRYGRGGIYTNLQHTSENQKLYLQFSNSLTFDNNRLVNPSANISGDILLSPNYPVYDETGNFNWFAGANPVAEIRATAKTRTDNVVNNILLRYAVTKALAVKISAGYNKITADQTQLFPTSALYPGTRNYTNFGKNSSQSFIAEPQADYVHHFDHSVLSLLAGGTYQYSIAKGEFIKARGYSSEGLMENLGSAGSYQTSNSYTQYKYASVFGRVNYVLGDKYIVNASVRQDASSKFGPGHRTGTFGAVGAAWLWGDEHVVRSVIPFISHGKLRASYGLTGNDQITDYQYLSTYGSSGYIYQDISGLAPSRIANADYHWETTKKLELALELGFFENRLLLNINRYQALSRDQLVAYTIPALTGFTSYQANLPAVVKNTGWEFELNTRNIQSDRFKWSTTFNITLPRNVLKSFQNLATSSYANTLVIGEDINRIYGYRFTGLDQNGSALYATRSGAPSHEPDSETDGFFTIGKQTPDLYGGIGNTITYRNWSLDIFGQFAKQMAMGNLSYIPGAQGSNNYSIAWNRWTDPSGKTTIPKASNYNDYYFSRSSANYFNASYFRVKNIALSWSFPKRWTQSAGVDQARLFLQGQNLLTFWHSHNPLLDPESGTFNFTSRNLPPVKSLVAGIQLTF